MNTINMTSIKNTRVRVKDIKAGVTIYVAHPVYGIEKRVIAGRPYMNANTNSLFVCCMCRFLSNGEVYYSDHSLRDMGITEGSSYNGRRTFFKMKHAEAWADKWKHDAGFKAQHARHEENIREWDEFDEFYGI